MHALARAVLRPIATVAQYPVIPTAMTLVNVTQTNNFNTLYYFERLFFYFAWYVTRKLYTYKHRRHQGLTASLWMRSGLKEQNYVNNTEEKKKSSFNLNQATYPILASRDKQDMQTQRDIKCKLQRKGRRKHLSRRKITEHVAGYETSNVLCGRILNWNSTKQH